MNWKADFYNRYSTIFGRSITLDSYRQFVPYGKYIIRRCFPTNKNVRILDMGCGIGGFLSVFSDEGYKNIQGVDVSKEDVAYAHKFGIHQIREGELYETLTTLDPESVDVILFIDVLEHFEREQILNILKEAFRLLSPGGCVIMHVPNAEGLFGARIRYADFTHELAFTSHSLSQISRYAGFNSFKCMEDKPLTHNPVSFLRRILWEIVTLPWRFLFAIESGSFSVRLSQNILFAAFK